MKKQSVLMGKSIKFAVRIVNLYKHISVEKKEFVLSKQILRSGTSIGANLSEAYCGSSEKDFLNKAYIAFKECSETLYWLYILKETEYITITQYNSLHKDCEELIKMLSATTNTTKGKMATSY